MGVLGNANGNGFGLVEKGGKYLVQDGVVADTKVTFDIVSGHPSISNTNYLGIEKSQFLGAVFELFDK
jgi:hypothetical protein